MTLDITTTIHKLGSGEVVLVGVHEEPGLQMVDRHRDRERSVRFDDVAVLGGLEL